MTDIFDFFLASYQDKPSFIIVIEAIIFIFGIISVLYAKKENILVYPTGLIATILSVYLLYKDKLMGDMMMNFYFSIMSIYGWWNWSRKKDNKYLIPISRTDNLEKIIGVGLFLITFLITYIVYKTSGVPIEVSNYIDMFTSGLFFVGMWYMAKKKLENWTIWIIADIITVPLYAYRGWGMLSLQYLIFTILAIQGYIVWKKNLNKPQLTS
ncbi:nicotinamide riboside transporter PnuC [Polaribacter sp. L3A8]|uniref:nicotinamide riboside transporter PnuC n=1 Tax=Polaribacter sp. L3A8 TaxID=2686361 RepID=UPI0018EF3152|nr:nicotinamide riboside transporter PnuC [Polaribacter sp. L3A8]